ncbi:MAG: DUF2238 domain-containing protein [Candidatus Nanoarchaeia archaeon]|nr:DUF2238 domain-containing protein [Candidatus Nanoarchaeia archaeon]
MNKNLALKLILFISILFMVFSTVVFVIAKNYEFLFSTALMIGIIIFFVLLYKKFRFSVLLLAGFMVLFMAHILGGYVYINGGRLYDYWILDGIIKYDFVVHFFGLFVVTFLVKHFLDIYMSKESGRFILFIFLVFVPLGISAFHEVLEMFAKIIFNDTGVGDYWNNALDLLFGLLGSIFASWLILRKKNKV